MSDLFAVRDNIADMLSGHFSDIRRSQERPSVTLYLPENPVGIVVGEVADGSIVITIEAPVLFDVPTPRPSVLRRLLSRGQRLEAARQGPGFGRVVMLFESANLVGEPDGGGDIFVETQVLAGAITAELLAKMVRLMHDTALSEIDYLREVMPPIGGRRAFEA